MTKSNFSNQSQKFFQNDVRSVNHIEGKGLNLQAIANDLKYAQDHCKQIVPLTSLNKDFGNAKAYAVANLIHEMRIIEGATKIGRKIGFTNQKLWSVYNVSEPIWAYIYDTTVVRLNCQHAKCNIKGFSEPKIEPEIVLHFCSTPPLDAEPEEILGCIDWIAHGIEIVQSHFPHWEFKTADTIANSGLHAKLFVGEPQELNNLGQEVLSDLETFKISLSCDGDLCAQGRGSNVLGSPLKAVLYLLQVINRYSEQEPLQSGELVTTGTLTDALSINAGQNWTTNLYGIKLPGISITFEN